MNSKTFLEFPQFDPIIFSISDTIALRWYGVMYLVGFLFALWLGIRRAKKPNSGWTRNDVEDLLFMGFLGVIIGGRVGYAVWYNFPALKEDFFYLFKMWDGGMSFHGGLVGVIIMMIFFAYRKKRHFFDVADFVAPLIPFGLGAGRLGNFINGELWGRVTDVSWGMRFPKAASADVMYANIHPEWAQYLYHNMLPRHPSQIYQMLLEGVVLFIILNGYARKPRPLGSISGLFLIGYGIFRFITEFFREPDIQLGLFANSISMGQVLSLPMILAGVIIMVWAQRRAIK